MVSALNEVVALTNIRTGQQSMQIYDKEALLGCVTFVASKGPLLAIGHSLGTILVLNTEQKIDEASQAKENLTLKCPFEVVHRFNFHKSAITALCFSNDSTKLISGGADTYLIQYDLVASVAEFKLVGHT